MSDRKKDHLNMALKSQTGKDQLDIRFDYEPLMAAHPIGGLKTFKFLGKTFHAPLWVSSMTGGTETAAKINRNLAMACKEFGFGMGLGSCRILIDSNKNIGDFDVRDIIGDELPLYANLGICQVEQLIENGQVDKIVKLKDRLRADGLIVHVNPIQEWLQPEGDTLKYPPIDTIKKLINITDIPIIVKEVGQGMGPASLSALLALPLAAIEFAAFGGTNFAKTELLRDTSASKKMFESLSNIGVDAYQMLDIVNKICDSGKKPECKQIIISGGITSFLDGYYLIQKSKLPSLFGQASSFLTYARDDYSKLQEFVSKQIKGLEMANAYLRVKEIP